MWGGSIQYKTPMLFVVGFVGKSIDEGPRLRKRMHIRKQARIGELVEQRGKSVSNLHC
jgi:hypothetical protein